MEDETLIATKAACGCLVLADIDPDSSSRKAIEATHCGKPRCESGLPKNFTDRECAAWVWLRHHSVGRLWRVEFHDKSVELYAGDRKSTLIELARERGWEG